MPLAWSLPREYQNQEPPQGWLHLVKNGNLLFVLLAKRIDGWADTPNDTRYRQGGMRTHNYPLGVFIGVRAYLRLGNFLAN